MAFIPTLPSTSTARPSVVRLSPRCSLQQRPQYLRNAAVAAALAATLALPLPFASLAAMDDVLIYDHDQGLNGADFNGRTDLRGAIFSKASCKGASFVGADLTNAQLDDANFIGASFKGAVAANVTATKAKFQKASLENAVFTNANFISAVFDTATIIEGADFSDSLLDRSTTAKLCKVASGVNPTTGVSTAESLGCPE